MNTSPSIKNNLLNPDILSNYIHNSAMGKSKQLLSQGSMKLMKKDSQAKFELLESAYITGVDDIITSYDRLMSPQASPLSPMEFYGSSILSSPSRVRNFKPILNPHPESINGLKPVITYNKKAFLKESTCKEF